MNQPFLIDRRKTPNPPMYVLGVVLFIVVFPFVQFFVIGCIYFAFYGLPSIAEFSTVRIPDYVHSVIWKERIWHGAMKLSPLNTTGSHGILMTLDPEKGGWAESSFTVPSPLIGLVLEGDRLWAVGSNSVVRIDGDQADDIKTTRILNRPCEPFFYQDQIAVIDSPTDEIPTLLVFKNDDWVEVGKVAIPFGFATSSDENGKTVLGPLPGTTPLRASLLDLQVIAIGRELHLFVSDGAVVAYKQGLEIASATALAPANVPAAVDLSDLSEWEVVCTTSWLVGNSGKRAWRATVVDETPVLVSVMASSKNELEPSPFFIYRRIDDVWQRVAESTTPALIELLAVSDGKKMYLPGLSLVQTLRFQRFQGNELSATGIVTKAPLIGFQSGIERYAHIEVWVKWIGYLPFMLGINYFMMKYRNSDYGFAKTQVQLASFLRRGIARGIDHSLYVIPGYFVALSFGFAGSQEQIERKLDTFFDGGMTGFFVRLAWMSLYILLTSLVILFVTSWFEGRSGFTLGKWICGIRTVGTTLRPCGFPRALLRELLFLADSVFVSTVLPATLLIAFTAKRQRIGDMVADTIVIRNPVEKKAEERLAESPIFIE